MTPRRQKVNNPVPRLKSLKSCFIALGADRADVYVGNNSYRRPYWPRLRSLYGREELLSWAHRLYIRAMKSIHPDHGGDEKQAATVNLAYERVQRILSVKRVCQ